MTAEPELELPDRADAKPPEQTFRVLFLDSPERNEMLKEACKEFGYAVVGASTVEEAWLFLNGTDHVDVIVCAAHLEEESMFKLLLAVRASELHKDAAFLILSLEPSPVGARLDAIAASAGRALGADAFVTMPVFDPIALVAHIRRLQPAVPSVLKSKPEDEEAGP
jgi:CheY-like chemotaxis protein